MNRKRGLVSVRIICSFLMVACLIVPATWYLMVYPMQFILSLTSAKATDAPPTDAWTKLKKVPFRARDASELYAAYWDKKGIALAADENSVEAAVNIAEAIKILPTESRRRLHREYITMSAIDDFYETSLICEVLASENGEVAVTASGNGLLRMWKPKSGTPIGHIMKHESIPCSVALADDNSCIAAAFSDGSVHLWSAPSGESKELITGIKDARTVRFHPLRADVILVGTLSGFLYRVETARHVAEQPQYIKLHAAITHLETNPHSKLAIVGCEDGVVFSVDVTTLQSKELHQSSGGIRRIYRAKSGKDYVVCDLRKTATALSLENALIKWEFVHTGLVTAVYQDDGGNVHTGTINGSLLQWRPGATTPLQQIALSHRAIIGLSKDESNGDIIVASLDGEIRRIPFESKSPSTLTSIPGGISSFYASASGTGIAGGFEGLAKIVLPRKAGVTEIKQGYDLFTISENLQRVAASQFFGGVTLMTGKKETIGELGANDVVTCLAFSPDSSMLGVGQLNGRVRIYDAENAKLKVEKLAHTTAIRILTFSRDAKKLLIVSADGGASIVDAEGLAEESKIDAKRVTAGAMGMLNDQPVVLLGGANGSLIARDFKGERLGVSAKTPTKAAITALVDMGDNSVLVGDENGSLVLWSPLTGTITIRGNNHRNRINALYRDRSRVYVITSRWVHVYGSCLWQ
jgi:WD40 repeat protein